MAESSLIVFLRFFVLCVMVISVFKAGFFTRVRIKSILTYHHDTLQWYF